jgi:probable rRNA maturation factor
MDADEQDDCIPLRADYRRPSPPRPTSSLASDEKIGVQIDKDFSDIDVSLPNLRKLVKTVCRRFNLAAATVSIAIVDDAGIRKINRQFLNRKAATDCLSFDLSDNQSSHKSFELIVNAERAVKEANRRGHSPEAELALYLTHALLHKLGFDDSTPAKARKMHDIEDEILLQFGYGFVYNH